MADDHYTSEADGKVGSILTPEQARAAHHLASADPELDGTLTGPAHEAKYGLERAKDSAALWRAAGVAPFRNGHLAEGDDADRGEDAPETTAAPAPPETATPPAAAAPKSAS